MSTAVAAKPMISSYTVGETGFLVINHCQVISLGASYRGLEVKQRIALLEKRINQILAGGGFVPEELQVVVTDELTGLSYRGQWLVTADPVTAARHHHTCLELAMLWRKNLLDAFGVITEKYRVLETFRGTASWYGKEFHGRRTANGELFNETQYTAAHRSLEFGTKVRVTNLQNQREVIVTINDRGPWIKGRDIDLSWAAAKAIGISGLEMVKIEILQEMH